MCLLLNYIFLSQSNLNCQRVKACRQCIHSAILLTLSIHRHVSQILERIYPSYLTYIPGHPARTKDILLYLDPTRPRQHAVHPMRSSHHLRHQNYKLLDPMESYILFLCQPNQVYYL